MKRTLLCSINRQMIMSSSTSIINKSNKKSPSRYIILRTLGKGAFGTVYLTYLQKGENYTKFALKETHQDDKYKNREGEVLKMLNHPNVVKVFSIFYSRKQKKRYLNIVMEFFPSSLHDLIESNMVKDEVLSYSDIKWYTLQLFRCVGYLETLNLCHRDIKPQNILVDHQKRVIKICDFGSAKQLTDAESNKHYICSRFYRAPELLCKSMFYSCSVDLWSVGCCMAEMYLNLPLFSGSNTLHQLALIKNVLSDIPKGYPSNVKTDYCVTPGLASATKWMKVLKIDKNYNELNYPIKQLNDMEQCHDLQFIRHILQYNPQKRFNLKQTLNHPYFKEFVFPESDNSIYPEIKWTKHETSILNSLSSKKVAN